MTPEEIKAQKEKQLAAMIQDIADPNEGFLATREKVKGLLTMVEQFKGLEASKILAQLELLKAKQESFTEMVKRSKHGPYISGIEDQKFSILRAMVAIRTGNWKGAEEEQKLMEAVREKASQSVGDDKRGGFFVPDQVIPDVIGGIYTRSVFINLVGEGTQRISVMEGLTGGNVHIPKFDGGLVAYWIGEEDEYAESQTDVEDVTMNPKKMGILVRITDTMRKLGSFGFEQLLRRDMERAAAKKLDWTILYGSGSDKMPRGVANTPGIKIYSAQSGTVVDHDTLATAQADWDGAVLDFDGLDNMLLALEEDDITLDESSAIIAAARYFRGLKQLKVDNYSAQAVNRPYLIGAPMLPDSRLRDIIGEFDKSNQIPTTNKPGASVGAPTDSTTEKYSDVLAGNLSTIVLGRWAALEIDSDMGKGKGFTSDHEYLKLRLYADVSVRQGRELILCPDAKVRA